jgi:hypothetical protein
MKKVSLIAALFVLVGCFTASANTNSINKAKMTDGKTTISTNYTLPMAAPALPPALAVQSKDNDATGWTCKDQNVTAYIVANDLPGMVNTAVLCTDDNPNQAAMTTNNGGTIQATASSGTITNISVATVNHSSEADKSPGDKAIATALNAGHNHSSGCTCSACATAVDIGNNTILRITV